MPNNDLILDCKVIGFHVRQVASENATGAADLEFLNADFTSAYINISNVVLKITPKHAASEKAVVVNAHFDSTLGSPGKPHAVAVACIKYTIHVYPAFHSASVSTA